MKKNNAEENYKKISTKLDNIIERGTDINRENILEAENIKYSRLPKNNESYDEFGFIDKYKDESEKKR